MIILRNLLTYSAIIFVILSNSGVGIAQELISLEKPAKKGDRPEVSFPAPVSNPEKGETQIVQTEENSPAVATEATPAPEEVNPSANPLIFPTEPDEVNIETVYPVTLNQAIEVALNNNKELQAARLQLERTQSQLDEALAALWPTLDAEFNFIQQDSATSRLSREVQIQQFGQSNIETDDTRIDGGLNLRYDIYTGGQRGATIRRTRRQLEVNRLEVERIAEQTRFDATSNYYDLQNADATVAIVQAAVEDATQSLRDAQLLEQAGLGTRFDVLQAEVDLANENQRLTRAIAQQRTARRQLAETLSIAQRIELTAADEINTAGSWPLSLEESIVQAYQNRAELEQFLIQREIGEQNREIALAGIRPTIGVQASYDVADDLQENVTIEDGYTLGVNARWVFFDGGAAKAQAEQANRDIDIAEVNFANQRNEIRLQVESAYFEYIANQENIGTTDTAVTTAEERLRLARLRFQAGVGTQTDVINAQRALSEARGNFLQAIIGYNQALNQLQRSVSNLPDNGLFEQR
ncbi:MAG: TolC family protein [Gomphosphaeria aponina SAG 52.96 = DSM 107014]|uniref:TolC family protein n=1 Tax=Gomphosphaeria aponina SAG 52.96 = DSM 107014 TaxID=1521640 RepID=A0A941JRC4_9CHRO|nr:TolC family protein [Gomphosphaeria aponina SAG 52.96 = DSM 107014]